MMTKDEHVEKIKNQLKTEPSNVSSYDTMSFRMEKGTFNINLQALHDVLQTILQPLSD